jgi:metaxin
MKLLAGKNSISIIQLFSSSILTSRYDRIVSYLKKEGYTIDETDRNEASLNYIRQNLYPFFMYQMFGNPQNLDSTRALLAQRTPFPFNFYYPSNYVRKTEEICQTVAGFSLQDSIDAHETAEIAMKAKKCLNWISEKLGSNEYFFNGSPSEVDATIYGYLAIILKFRLPNHALQSHASSSANLVKYVDHITKQFFKESELFESQQVKEENKKKEQKVFTGQEDEDPPSVVRKRYLVSGIFAAISMFSFGYYTGIFSVMSFRFNLDD